MMEKSPQLPPDLQKNLVAYLDGELDEETAQEIEQTLADSPEARREVETLTRTWELLDALPQIRASEEFTERTLSTITVDKLKTPATPVDWKRRLRRAALLTGCAAGLVLAVVIGFLSTNRWVQTESDLLVEELPVIENIDMYTEVDSVEFLRQLQESQVFNGDPQQDLP